MGEVFRNKEAGLLLLSYSEKIWSRDNVDRDSNSDSDSDSDSEALLYYVEMW